MKLNVVSYLIFQIMDCGFLFIFKDKIPSGDSTFWNRTFKNNDQNWMGKFHMDLFRQTFVNSEIVCIDLVGRTYIIR